MDHLRDQSLNLDSPSKHSYVGSFHLPPEKLIRPLNINTTTRPPDKNVSGLPEISPQLYRAAPAAGSRAVLAALKTLQEKMRRLELERAQVAQRFCQHQMNLSAQADQHNSTNEKDSTQKTELVSKLQSTETRCSLLEKQLDYMKRMMACAERERVTQTERQECRESTHTDPKVQEQLNKLERLEKEYLKITSTQSMAERKIELLEQKLLLEEHQRKLVQEKAEELQKELERNILSLSAATQPQKGRKKKKDKTSCRKSPSAKVEAAPPQYPAKAKRLLFVAGTSTSPSHSVSANVQSVLHMMKHRNPRLCERGSENQRAQHRPPSSPDKVASSLGSLSEILLALQDELGQMSFEHQELVRQIDETDKRDLREDLERELDCLVRRMEEKATQISKLRKHQQTVQKLSQPSCSPKADKKQERPHRAASAEDKTRAQSGVQALPPSPVKASPGKGQKQCRTSHGSLKLLRETQKLSSSLRRQDVAWET